MLQKNKLDFSDFFSISSEQWKKNILKELKASSEEALLTISEAITIKGFYTQQDTKHLEYLHEFHERYKVKSPRHWYSCEYIPFTGSSEWNRYANTALKSGADALLIDSKEAPKSTQELFNNIPLGFSPIILKCEVGYTNFLQELIRNKQEIKGVIEIKHLLKSFSENESTCINELSNAISLAAAFPKLKVLGLAVDPHETNPVEQITSILGIALDLIDKLTNKDIPIHDVLSQFSFSLDIGKNYLIEIAKLRALRVLWDKIAHSCDPNFNSFSTPIHCTTSEDLSVNDPNIHNIQNTTKAMAAIIGGCDILTVIPADKNIHSHNDFSARIARNISLILKEEAHLDYVVDPAAGAYAIEALTDQIAKTALAKIKEIEMDGGLIQSLKGTNIR